MKNKGQVTIFIIIAILVVALVSSYFIFRDDLFGVAVPSQVEPVYNSFTSCLEEELLAGIGVLESQGGYIYLPDYSPASEKYPFSSQLNFAGTPVPYWYYVSGNGIEKEQVPDIRDMESDLEEFMISQIDNCNFNDYYAQGFEINLENEQANVNVRDRQVSLDLNADLSVIRGEERFFADNHRVTVNSNLGSLYNDAIEVYRQEQNELFLEEYAVDNLRLYAPVDGVEITCAPKIWEANNIFDELADGIEVNTMALHDGNRNEDYFDVDLNANHEIRFINSRNWPSSFEVLPGESNILTAEPIGNQPGLGALGFCYVPYHFVYNINYPVLVQLEEGEEIFQFPVGVVIQGNQPRESLDASALDLEEPQLCRYKNSQTTVQVYDSNSNLIPANITYSCFGTSCEIGESTNGILETDFPQCVNGRIHVEAEGYKDAKIQHSTVQESSVNIILDKEYEKQIRFRIDGELYDDEAFITLSSDESSQTITYPYQDEVILSRGEYELEVRVFENSSLTLEGTTTEQCAEVPRGFVGGIFGLTKEECFEVEIPEQIISRSLSGGGTSTFSFQENNLRTSEFLDINVQSLPKPTNLEELQVNYILFEGREVEAALR